MTTKEYLKTAQKARALLLEAYVEFVDGDDHLKACDKLWQAASHAITAAAQQRGWDCDDNLESLHAIVDRLSEETGQPQMISGFSALQMFRDNVEFDFMEDFQLKSGRPRARRFIEYILSLQESSTDSSPKC
jgi:hypothetical protein